MKEKIQLFPLAGSKWRLSGIQTYDELHCMASSQLHHVRDNINPYLIRHSVVT